AQTTKPISRYWAIRDCLFERRQDGNGEGSGSGSGKSRSGRLDVQLRRTGVGIFRAFERSKKDVAGGSGDSSAGGSAGNGGTLRSGSGGGGRPLSEIFFRKTKGYGGRS